MVVEPEISQPLCVRVDELPEVAVIIPVYNSARMLEQCLSAVAASELPSYECIVVDDGSTDESPKVAKRFGARLLHTKGRRGPGYARNIGVKATTAEFVFFTDSDVCVQPDTVARLVGELKRDEGLAAVMGSYDDEPASPGFISQYKNLMHCYVHHAGRREASTFWTGCGAIRRETMLRFGGFDVERYARPSIEDIDLGTRMHVAGERLELDARVEVKHLKHWTLAGMIKTDIRDRGVPWTELILRSGEMPNDLNVQKSQRLSVVLAWGFVLLAAGLAIGGKSQVLLPLCATLLVLLSGYWLDDANTGNWWARVSLPLVLGLFDWAAWREGMNGLIAPVMVTYAALWLRYYWPDKWWTARQVWLAAAGAYATLGLGLACVMLPGAWMLFPMYGLLVWIVLLNLGFYRFLEERRGMIFALSAIPLHLLYHAYNGISFGIGLSRHLWRRMARAEARAVAG